MSTKETVLSYTHCTANIFFPEGEVRCSLCPLQETYARKQCRLTGEYLAEGYLRGGQCPLEIHDGEYKYSPDPIIKEE